MYNYYDFEKSERDEDFVKLKKVDLVVRSHFAIAYYYTNQSNKFIFCQIDYFQELKSKNILYNSMFDYSILKIQEYSNKLFIFEIFLRSTISIMLRQ